MPDPAMTDRLIRVVCTESHAFVVPPDDAKPFFFPRVHRSQLLWLDHLTAAFMTRQHRCLCVALMLDLSRQAWGRPEIPTQCCDAEGVHWTWSAEDFADRGPSLRVAGSYQSAKVQDALEAITLVPPTDGVHFVRAKGPKPALYAFLHADDLTVVVHDRTIVLDDVTAAIDANAGRLTLA